MAKPDFVELQPIEKSRKYTFPSGATVELEAVKRLAVSESGTHRIETADGIKHIVPSGWIHIEIVTDEWTF